MVSVPAVTVQSSPTAAVLSVIGVKVKTLQMCDPEAPVRSSGSSLLSSTRCCLSLSVHSLKSLLS